MNKRTALSLTAVLSMASAYAQTAPKTNNALTATQVKNAVVDSNLVADPITVNTGTYVGPLSTLLAGIARSANYEIVFNFNVDALQLINGEIIKANSVSGNNAGAVATGVGATTGTTGNNSNIGAISNNNIASPSADAPLAYATPLGKPAEIPAKPVVYNFINKPFNQVWPLLMDVYDLQYEIVNMGNGKVIRISQRPAQLAIPLHYVTAKYAQQKALEFFGEPTYSEIPIYDRDGKVVDKVRQFDRYVLTSGSMRILADDENNRLIAGGTTEESTKIRSFVSTIDVPKSSNSDTPQGQNIYSAIGSTEDVVNVLKSQYPDLVVTPVGKTSQLIITGPQTKIDAALALLGKVDKATSTGPAISQKVFQLVNASAEEVKATLEGALQRDITSVSAQTGTGTTLLDVNGNPISALVPPSQQASADAQGLKTTSQVTNTTASNANSATIIADKRTNTLVVRGTQSQVDQIAELIPQLDKTVPQVNIQVRIQEVTDEAVRNLGLNGRINVGGFNIFTSAGNGLSASFDPTQSFVGFNIFPTLTALETQNMAKRVYDGNVTMQSGQRSLGSNSQTENSSSNAAATVKAGGRLEINIPSQAANIPPIQKQIDYGVNLDFINPQVAPDGTITLRVRGQVNTAPSNISPNAIPYVLNFKNSEAQSIVTFKSGETLLLAGLMGQESTKDNSGLPFLSSFGIGGNAKTSKKMSQLLVIITGTIVK